MGPQHWSKVDPFLFAPLGVDEQDTLPPFGKVLPNRTTIVRLSNMRCNALLRRSHQQNRSSLAEYILLSVSCHNNTVNVDGESTPLTNCSLRRR